MQVQIKLDSFHLIIDYEHAAVAVGLIVFQVNIIKQLTTWCKLIVGLLQTNKT